jgi:hypothetical protein
VPAVGSAPFVGRERELAQIGAALDGAAAGRGQLLMLVGEPGIGKTSLADRAAALATARGFTVLWGRCWEAGGAPAYWPWLDPITALAGALDDATLARVLGDGSPLLAEIVRELRARLPDTPAGAPPPDPLPNPCISVLGYEGGTEGRPGRPLLTKGHDVRPWESQVAGPTPPVHPEQLLGLDARIRKAGKRRRVPR